VNPPDPRLHAYRPDLADEALRGTVEAERFVAGRPARVSVPVADMHAEPGGGLATQLLLGDAVRVFEERDGWAWVQADHDSYVGYVASPALAPAGPAPTHMVSAARTFTYPGPDLKRPRHACLSMGAAVAVTGFVENRGTRYAMLASREAVVASHLAAIGEVLADYVAAAEMLEGTPYLWGGASAFGIDCSGLVQLAMRMAGRRVPRDSDMQAASVGTPLDPGEGLTGLRRGDLVFWQGHVAIMTDAGAVLHANGHTMTVARENLDEAIERISHLYGRPTGFRRP
jgi:cell wall-associated NlpC family hydrolase